MSAYFMTIELWKTLTEEQRDSWFRHIKNLPLD